MKIKAMTEKRNKLYDKAQEIFNKAADEERELTSEEDAQFEELCAKVKKYDDMIDKAKELRRTSENPAEDINNLDPRDFENGEPADISGMKQFAADVRELAGYIRAKAAGKEIMGNASNLTYGDNGAVIKHTIINKILEKVDDITPLYQLCNKYTVAGTLTIPKEDETTDSVTVALATEFTDLESHSSKLTAVSLEPQLYGCLVKVSRKLIGSSDFDLVNWLIGKIARKLAVWYDLVIIKGIASGNTQVIDGILHSYDSTNMKKVLASKTAVTADEIIDLQELVPDALQAGAFFVMARSTRRAIRKLKDTTNNYLLVSDNNSRFGKRLFESDVYTTPAMDELGANATDKLIMLYVNPQGVALQEPPTKELQILNEKFATQHATGIVMWGEIDAEVEDTQAVAALVTPAS